ncbi:MAG: PspA/IM30 family protein [Planctomycetaceae bacterium]|jgi:phage shock protein A
MTYYSRLSDIVSYRLEDLLAESQDRRGAIGRIVSEIRDGLAGAQRSVTGAQKSVDRLLVELSERQAQAESLNTEARQQLVAGNEADARQTLLRRRECLDLRAGIEQQLVAAHSTHEHLQTILKAVEARLAEALRLQAELHSGRLVLVAMNDIPEKSLSNNPPSETARMKLVEEDLLALRRELGRT